MIIELQVNWTFATPPSTPPSYPVDIYWRIVGDSFYEMQTITTGESGTATITILNSTSNTISDREKPCIWEIEGYVVPSCALNAIEQRVDFTTSPALDLTDDMQCRGITAECKAGGIIGIIPDQDLSLLFNTDLLNFPITIDTASFAGSGDSAKLPNIAIEFTNSGNPTSTIKTIRCYDVDYSGGFISGLTTFDITGFNGSGGVLTMTPQEIITACGSILPVNDECYSGTNSYIPFITTDGGIIKTCTNNPTTYDDVYLGAETIGSVQVVEEYSCCQISECKLYNVTRTNIPELPAISTAIPFLIGYIDPITGQYDTVTMAPGQISIQIFAIEDTIHPYGFDTTTYTPPSFGETVANLNATYWLLGGITVTAVGACGSIHS
jgi:hypothetical protein